MSITESSKSQRLVFPAGKQVVVESYDPGLPGKGQVRVKTHLSLMSTGTENIAFNRHFDPGTHWDRYVKYPFYPGYSSIGVVEAIGEGVDTLRVGDRVALRAGHQSHTTLDAASNVGPVSCYAIPQSVPFDQAVWFALAKIAFHGAKAANYQLGDSVLIIGAGPIGQMSIRWARAAGVADIIVVDTAANRMPLAEAGGATATVTAPIDQARESILQASGGKLPRVVIDSTGNAAVFSAALSLAGDRGRVVIMGDTGQPASQTLTSDVIIRGLTIVGAHDGHTTAEWNTATITRLFFSLAATGRFPLEGLNTHRFHPEQCAEAYATANRERSSTMGIVFTWVGR